MPSSNLKLSDEELAAQISFSPDVYKILVERHRENLLSFIFHSYLKDYDQAADIVQETFIRAYFRNSTFDSSKKWKTWLYTIAINCVKTFLAKPKSENIDNFNIASEILPDQELEKNLTNQKLLECLGTIDYAHAKILELYYFQSLSYKEIAKQLKIPVYSVKTRVNYAEKVLKRSYIGN